MNQFLSVFLVYYCSTDTQTQIHAQTHTHTRKHRHTHTHTYIHRINIQSHMHIHTNRQNIDTHTHTHTHSQTLFLVLKYSFCQWQWHASTKYHMYRFQSNFPRAGCQCHGEENEYFKLFCDFFPVFYNRPWTFYMRGISQNILTRLRCKRFWRKISVSFTRNARITIFCARYDFILKIKIAAFLTFENHRVLSCQQKD